ncbi:hypothetical protein KOI40_03285 [Aestuariicella sp. G3-2]|uniref:hypothetical protein n=1 Tax=Pseudomaricurvus albidus TaxID=2842452 RepID=UPI001C0DDB01|nr:hypothetical protein [Aestuariicella albida]MBU3068826.1 hypothetical protein [Aestuariicella albida]
MEFIVILASAFSGLILGSVFGFAITGHTQIMEGCEFYPRNPIMRFFVTAPKDRTITQNLIYFVLMVSWFFVFIGLVALPFILSESFGPLRSWSDIAIFMFLGLGLFCGKIIGGMLWLRCR